LTMDWQGVHVTSSIRQLAKIMPTKQTDPALPSRRARLRS
jgi:hypothetical protein